MVEEAHPGVSVIMPVLNEALHLEAAVRAILDQGYAGPFDVVLAIGPSHDATAAVAAELARDPRVRLVENPSGSTPAGLNAALAVCSHPVVVRVDGHAELPSGYITRAVNTLERTGAANVGGVMAAVGTNDFECAVAAAMTSRFGVGGARFHTGGEEGPADTVYLGAFRRAVLERLGGYDEHFVRAQDWELNHRIRQSGEVVWFDPGLLVTYRPRPDLRSLARQYRDYGRWRRAVIRTAPGTVSLRYLAPPVTVAAVGLGTVAGLVGIATGVSALLAGFVLPVGYAVAVLVAAARAPRPLSVRSRALLLAVYPTMHASWGWGFLTSPRRLAAVRSTPQPASGPSAAV